MQITPNLPILITAFAGLRRSTNIYLAPVVYLSIFWIVIGLAKES